MSVTLMWSCPIRPSAMSRHLLNPSKILTMVKDRVQRSVLTADLLHSAAVRLLRRARPADVEMDLGGPRASLLSVLAYRGPLPVTRLAEIEQVTPPAITKLVAA